MKNEISVLITASGSLGTIGLIECLKNNNEKRKIRIVCADVYDQPILHFKADSFHLLPKGNSKNYIKSLIKLCKKEKINVVLPCSGTEIFSISKNLDLLKSNRIFPTVSNYDAIKITMKKDKVYELLGKNQIPVPKYFVVHNKREFLKVIKKLGYPAKPICFKPARFNQSGGSKGFRILRAKNSISDIVLQQKPDSPEIDFKTSLRLFAENKSVEILVMEYLPGEELAVHALVNHGGLISCVCTKIFSREQGYTKHSIIQKNTKLTSICKDIFKIMDFNYNINLQFKISEEKIPKLVEINPRVAGGVSLATAAGTNLPYLAIKLALGEKLSKYKVIKNTSLIRYSKYLYVKNGKNFEFV